MYSFQNDTTGEQINANESEVDTRAQSSRSSMPKKRKVSHTKAEEMKRQALVQKAFDTLNQDTDECEGLGKTYAAKLRRMDINQRDIADKLINEILFKGIQNHLTFNTTVSHNEYNTFSQNNWISTPTPSSASNQSFPGSSTCYYQLQSP